MCIDFIEIDLGLLIDKFHQELSVCHTIVAGSFHVLFTKIWLSCKSSSEEKEGFMPSFPEHHFQGKKRNS